MIFAGYAGWLPAAGVEGRNESAVCLYENDSVNEKGV